MKRRDFIKVTGSGLAAVAVAGPGAAASGQEATAQAAPRRPIRKGFMLGTFRTEPKREISVLEQFRMLKEAGFEGVEPSSGLDQNEVLRAAESTGLEIPSVVVDTHWRSPLSHPDPKVREVTVEELKSALRKGRAYGSRSVLLVPGVVNAEVSYDDCYRRSQTEIRKVVPLAQELGVNIAIENVWNHFLLSPLESARYVDEFDNPAVAWHFDIGNILNYGWPEQWISILGKRIVTLHFKEFSREKRDEEGLWKGFQVELLEGDNDWPAIVNSLDSLEFSGWGIAEPPYRTPGLADQTWLNNLAKQMDQILAM